MIRVGAVNGEGDGRLIRDSYGVTTYPTIKYFGLSRNKASQEYMGERDAKGIVNFAIE